MWSPSQRQGLNWLSTPTPPLYSTRMLLCTLTHMTHVPSTAHNMISHTLTVTAEFRFVNDLAQGGPAGARASACPTAQDRFIRLWPVVVVESTMRLSYEMKSGKKRSDFSYLNKTCAMKVRIHPKTREILWFATRELPNTTKKERRKHTQAHLSITNRRNLITPTNNITNPNHNNQPQILKY